MNKNSKVLNLKKTTLVVTSINKRNEAIKKFEKLCKKNNTDFIFVADKKTPKFKYGNDLKFLSLKEIYETDDDNYPKKNFFSQNIENLKHYRIKENGFINIYKYFLNKKIDIWPRGLPLSKIKTAKKSFIELKIQSKKFSIIQRLCDENPDVDAIYRLINKKIDIKFDKNKSFYVNNKSYIPFNSQNTIWFKEAFPLMYLPTYCTMRATDIWRSYIATHIMNKLNMKILFTSSTVYQKRNIHNLYNDFKLEIPVYIDVENLIKELNTIKIYNAKDYMLINLFNCYKKLVDKKFFDKRELKLIKLWCEDISEIDPNYIKV